MGRIIRRTVTITITETWTIVWAGDVQSDAKTQSQTTTVVQDNPKEEPDELLHATVIAAEPMPATVTEPPPDDVSIQPDAKGRRPRRRR